MSLTVAPRKYLICTLVSPLDIFHHCNPLTRESPSITTRFSASDSWVELATVCCELLVCSSSFFLLLYFLFFLPPWLFFFADAVTQPFFCLVDSDDLTLTASVVVGLVVPTAVNSWAFPGIGFKLFLCKIPIVEVSVDLSFSRVLITSFNS